MKTLSMIYTMSLALSIASSSIAGDGKPVEQKNTLRSPDAIYNEIMLSLPADVKVKLDSTRSRSQIQRPETAGADSAGRVLDLQEKAREQKARHIEELPIEVRQQVEKAMQEMEQRQKERELEFKEMKRGR